MNSAHPDRKQKFKHEMQEMLLLFGYLAFFFCMLVTYSTLLLRRYQVEYWAFSIALINALVITKVIMIGDYLKVGRKHESKPLLLTAIWKAFLFGLLVFAFHIIEEIVKRLIHGADMAKASREVRFDEMATRAIVVFCAFVPLFLFREFRRVMGEETFSGLVFGGRKSALGKESTSQVSSTT